MCAHVYACVFVCACVHVCARVCACMHVCSCVRTHTQAGKLCVACAQEFACEHTGMSVPCAPVWRHLPGHTSPGTPSPSLFWHMSMASVLPGQVPSSPHLGLQPSGVLSVIWNLSCSLAPGVGSHHCPLPGTRENQEVATTEDQGRWQGKANSCQFSGIHCLAGASGHCVCLRDYP